MTNEFGMPEFMGENEEAPKDPFFEGSAPNGVEGVVFVVQQGPVPVLPDGEPPKFESLTEEELIGVYITTNAMMNILIEKGIISQRDLALKVQEIKKAYLDSKK